MLAIETSTFPDEGTQLATLTSPIYQGVTGRRVGRAKTQIVERKEHVFHEGDDATHIFKVECGHVCIYRTLDDGRRQVIDFAFPGDFIGLGAAEQHTMSAQATERTRLTFLPTSELRSIVRENPALGLELYQAISSQLSATREMLVAVGQRSAEERLAGFLLTLSRRNASRGQDASTIVLPMTRSDIADYLGMTIETVSRMMTKMRKQGLIDIEQCILVTINDAEALADIASGKLR